MCHELPGLSDQQLSDARVLDAVLRAIQKGLIEFVIAVLSTKNELVWSKTRETLRNTFMWAVQHRQHKIFCLIYRCHIKNAILPSVDSKNNNILHVAAILDSSSGLRTVPGAALQMQRELQWYKVKSLSLYYFDLISQLYTIYLFFFSWEGIIFFCFNLK